VNPAITVLLPVYNAEAFIGEAVKSVLEQTYTDFELLIINDGSTDSSKAIIQSFNDPRIRLVENEKNLRLIATLNKGIDLARGKYIARMDADDISMPERLERQFQFMETHPEVGICGSAFHAFGKEEGTVRYPEKNEDIRMMMLYQTPFCHPAVIFRKETLVANRLYFNPEYLHAEDYEFWVRAADYTNFANMHEVLLKYRIHEEKVSVQHRDIQEQNTIRIIREYLRKAGVMLNNNEVASLRNVAYASFTHDKEEFSACENVLLKLMEGNRRSPYLPAAQLEKFIAAKWANLCLNATALGWWLLKKHNQSPLSRLESDVSFLRTKLLIKSLLKR